MTNRFFKSIFEGPYISHHSTKNSCWIFAIFSCPIRECQGFILKGEPNCISSISSLLNMGCPSHIAWSIITIIINAINGLFWRRPWTGILVEIFKRMPPTITDFYSSSSISRKIFIVAVMASTFHAVPNVQFWN